MKSGFRVTVCIVIFCVLISGGGFAADLDDDAASADKKVKRSVTMEEMMRIAVRYFYPHFVKDELHMHICVGINGMNDYPGAIDNTVKAFCIQSIHNAMRAGETDVHKQAYALVRDAHSVKLSKDLETEIHRIQGAVWVQMMQNKELRRLLRAAYAKQKDSLSFCLKPPESETPSINKAEAQNSKSEKRTK